jgi:hypothetical protein
MRFVDDCVDYGDAPTFFASGVAAVHVVAAGVLEVVLFRKVTLPCGASENRIISRTIWAKDEWTQACLVAAQAEAMLQSGGTVVALPISTSH